MSSQHLTDLRPLSYFFQEATGSSVTVRADLHREAGTLVVLFLSALQPTNLRISIFNHIFQYFESHFSIFGRHKLTSIKGHSAHIKGM